MEGQVVDLLTFSPAPRPGAGFREAAAAGAGPGCAKGSLPRDGPRERLAAGFATLAIGPTSFGGGRNAAHGGPRLRRARRRAP